MTNASAPPAPPRLDEVRQQIDTVDGQILALLKTRFALVDSVRAAKGSEASPWPSPLRPAREMEILRRLVSQRGDLPAELLVRLWRGIITDSTLKQSPMTIHVPKKLAQGMGHRLRIRDYFGRFAVEEWRDEGQALVQINANPADICIVETESGWAEPFMAGQAGKAQVLGILPVLKQEDAPRLLILGLAPSQATGEDETLLISKGSLPRDFGIQPVWQGKSGPYRLSALAGNYSEHESPLVGLARSNPGLGLRVAGRYASAIEV
ncbi:MAG: chorismate mutase [Hyphomicrobiales bacterium]